MHSLLMLKIGTLNNAKNTQFSMLNEEISRPDFQQFITQQPTILKKDPNWKQKCARLPRPIDARNVPTGENN